MLRRLLAKTRSVWADTWNRRHDAGRSTYAADAPVGPLLPILGPLSLPALGLDAEPLKALAGHAAGHRFDLLGSGWVEVKHGMDCRGVEGYRYHDDIRVNADPEGAWLADRITPANLAESRRRWKLVSRGYTPIDWHLDFKSGYRWRERTWYRDVPYGHWPGADIKVPWELARMQSLPLLALAHGMESPGVTSPASIWVQEFRDQVLDFIATNPPRFGVNWASTMDVAIRAVNLLVGWDLFRGHGVSFDAPFQAVFARSVLEHARHIVANLEWTPGFRGNHYLADLAGLLFCSVYLPRSPETDSWLAFAVQELDKEAECQFLEDGSNFEASTCYHRLSTEMLIYCTALVLGLSDDKRAALRVESPFRGVHFERLEQAVEFTMHLTKPSHGVVQIGDNDSGRFLKLLPPVHRRSVAQARALYGNLDGYAALPDHAAYWAEDHLDHRQLIAAMSGLVQRSDFAGMVDQCELETWMIRGLARQRRVDSYRGGADPTAAERRVHDAPEKLDRLEQQLLELAGAQRSSISLPMPGGSLKGDLVLYAYPDFGAYVFRSSRLFLCIRCGSIGQRGLGGHAHNDQLSLEVTLDGKEWIADPGSYLYTPLPARRNQFRSMWAHFGPRFEGPEPGRLDLGLFRLGNESVARCLHFSAAGFAGVLTSRGRTTHSVVRVGDQGLTVQYFCVGDRLSTRPTDGRDWKSELPAVPFSPGYGIVTRAKAGTCGQEGG
jgi:heparinase II/III-like protein